MNSCVLCQHPQTGPTLSFPDDKRTYIRCSNCNLIRVDESFLLTSDREKERYLHHLSDAGSEGHKQHLKHALSPALSFISPLSRCLDFGCGPKPVLRDLLAQSGILCDSYDLYFFPSLQPNIRYDHIFCLETAEHLFDPRREFTLIHQLLKPGGHVTFMTEWYHNPEDMKDWYYKRDYTHVIFFHEKTWAYISQTFRWQTVYSDQKRVIIFKKVTDTP